MVHRAANPQSITRLPDYPICLCRALPVHHLRREVGGVAEVDEIGGHRVALRRGAPRAGNVRARPESIGKGLTSPADRPIEPLCNCASDL